MQTLKRGKHNRNKRTNEQTNKQKRPILASKLRLIQDDFLHCHLANFNKKKKRSDFHFYAAKEDP